MFEQIFDSIDKALFLDAGADSELDYIEQTSWILFLRYLDDLEQTRAIQAKLKKQAYQPLLEDAFRWRTWAAPTTPDGKPDHARRRAGDDLIAFVNGELFPYLAKQKQNAAPRTIHYRIGEVFSELQNKIRSGVILQDILDQADLLSFQRTQQKHELSHLYETKIKRMGNAGRNGGQYYTPRPLIRAIIQTLDPPLGKTIYDGACGSAGFLCEAYEFLRAKCERSCNTKTLEALETRTLYGKEKKTLAYIIAIMNMILHGIESPNITRANTLNQNLSDINERDRYDYILANPPFGGRERAEIKENFPIKTGETAFLFLQHFIKSLRAGGAAGVVIKNTFLSNTDNATIELRKHLLARCDLYCILDMPSGTFQGAGVKTVVLFFEKGKPTQDIWYYQLNTGRSLGKTSSLNDDDMADFIKLAKTRATSSNSWIIKRADISEDTADLTVSNPNTPQAAPLPPPADIIKAIIARDQQNAKLLQQIQQLVK